MVAYTKPQQRKKEESKQLRAERDKIKFLNQILQHKCILLFPLSSNQQNIESANFLVKSPLIQPVNCVKEFISLL